MTQLPKADELLALIKKRIDEHKRGMLPKSGEASNSKLLELSLSVFGERVAVAEDQFMALWVLTYLNGGAVTLPREVMEKYPGAKAQLTVNPAENGRDHVIAIPGMAGDGIPFDQKTIQ